MIWLYLFSITFILNFFWEVAQTPLYAPHFDGVWGLILVHLKASGGDVLMVGIILILNAVIFRKWSWFCGFNKNKIILTVFWGFILAAGVEFYALSTNRWGYNDLMPIIPILNVGLTPTLQMMILPTLGFWINNRILYTSINDNKFSDS